MNFIQTLLDGYLLNLLAQISLDECIHKYYWTSFKQTEWVYAYTLLKEFWHKNVIVAAFTLLLDEFCTNIIEWGSI